MVEGDKKSLLAVEGGGRGCWVEGLPIVEKVLTLEKLSSS